MNRLLIIALLLPSLAYGLQTLHFGVFAARNNNAVIYEYQPLVNYLNMHLNGYRIELIALERNEMENALKRNQIDIFSTNPSHYEILRQHNLLTRVIATTQHRQKGVLTENFGGVIFSNSNNRFINHLGDIKGKKIASMDSKSLGAYQAQVYECLQHNIDLTKEAKLRIYHQQDAIVRAVLSNEADIGFIRTGVLEAMFKEGKLKRDQVRILNQQRMEYFPYLLSTRLYPEWPVAIMPHIDEALAKQLIILLLNYSPPSTQNSSIGGFTLPQNYEAITNLVKTLRLPPYDHAKPISGKDIFQQYTGMTPKY